MTEGDHSKKGDEIEVSPNVNLTALVDGFRKEYGIHRIVAFSGGSDNRPDGIDDPDLEKSIIEALRQKEQHIIAQAVQRLQGYGIAILCGGTKWGVPNTAAQEARKVGLTTIGVYPFTGKKHALGPEILDLRICVEPELGTSRWGDESSIFAKLLDGVIVYGGSAGTLVEIAHILKMNESIIDKCGEPKFIVPISGSGGVADGLPFVWGKPRVKAVSIPTETITSGYRAAELLIERLNIADFFEL